MIAQIAGDGELASVERRVADAVETVFGDELQRDEVAAGTADDDFAFDDAHSWFQTAFSNLAARGGSTMATVPLRRPSDSSVQ